MADTEWVVDAWRSYLGTHREADVRSLADAYPSDRSLTVDLLELHDVDPDLVDALFDDPVGVLRAGREALEAVGAFAGPVFVRPTNNPQQLSASSVRARHVHELVTVDGVVESIGPPRATAATAAFECLDCGARRDVRVGGIELSEPSDCPECDGRGGFAFRPAESSFVDLQRATVASPDEDGESLSVYLSANLVGTVTAGQRCRTTGILRPRRAEHSNAFETYLDATTVSDEQWGVEPDDFREMLDAYWTES